jgi:hypothetical protein
MAYTIAGEYVVSCTCANICGCAMDRQPVDPQGREQCHSALTFRVDRGSLDDVDLAGVTVAMLAYFTKNLTAGNWKVRLVVDTAASEEQAQAIERIFLGKDGGPFAEFAPLIGEYTGVQRAQVEISDGDKPSVRVGDLASFSYQGLMGPDGNPTTVRNAMLAFAPEIQIGTTTGDLNIFGTSAASNYGERAAFEFSSEMGG